MQPLGPLPPGADMAYHHIVASIIAMTGRDGKAVKAFPPAEWRQWDEAEPSATLPDIIENLPPGIDIPRLYKFAINAVRANFVMTVNMVKWGLKPSDECLCEEKPRGP